MTAIFSNEASPSSTLRFGAFSIRFELIDPFALTPFGGDFGRVPSLAETPFRAGTVVLLGPGPGMGPSELFRFLVACGSALGGGCCLLLDDLKKNDMAAGGLPKTS